MDLRALVQDDGAEGRVLISCESTETTSSCGTTADRRTREHTRKRRPRPETDKQPPRDGSRGTATTQSHPVPAGWATHKLEGSNANAALPLMWRFWTPREASQPGGPIKALGIPREPDLDGPRDLTTGLPQDWGNRLQSWRAQRILHTPRPRGEEQWSHWRLNQTYLLVLEGLLRRRGSAGLPTGTGALAAATLEGRPQRKPSLRSSLTYHQPLRSQGQAASSQPHPSADNWIKALQSKTQFLPLPVPPIRKLIQAS